MAASALIGWDQHDGMANLFVAVASRRERRWQRLRLRRLRKSGLARGARQKVPSRKNLVRMFLVASLLLVAMASNRGPALHVVPLGRLSVAGVAPCAACAAIGLRALHENPPPQGLLEQVTKGIATRSKDATKGAPGPTTSSKGQFY